MVRALLQQLARQGLRKTLRAPLDPYPLELPPAVHPFDRAYAVDTSGYLHGSALSAPRLRRTSTLWATAYYAVAPSIFDAAMTLLTAATGDLALYTFLDLGCGKGRALLLASRYPFRQILGVELDAQLAAVAQGNLRSFSAPWQQCRSVEVQRADAATLTFPPTPLVLFLYHPFLPPVLTRVLRRLTRSLARHPREAWIVYLNPDEAAPTLSRFPAFREHTRATLPLAAEDQIADRPATPTEDLALYRYSAGSAGI